MVIVAAADLDRDGRAAARLALDGEAAAEPLRPFPHAVQAEMPLLRALLVADRKACTVVLHRRLDRMRRRVVAHLNGDRLGPPVPQGVVDRLLHDQEEVARHKVGHVVELAGGLDVDPGGVSLADPAGERLERLGKRLLAQTELCSSPVAWFTMRRATSKCTFDSASS